MIQFSSHIDIIFKTSALQDILVIQSIGYHRKLHESKMLLNRPHNDITNGMCT